MKMLAVVTCVVLAVTSQAMAQLPGLAGTSFSQSYSTASGLSKITFKRTASKGALDWRAFYIIDPCPTASQPYGPGLEVDITNSLGLYGLALAPPNALWATTTCDIGSVAGTATDSGSLDTGPCKIRFKLTVDDLSSALIHGSVSAKCSLPIPVAPTSAAYLQFVRDDSGLLFYPMCFLSSGLGAAEVVKDGSDGKHVKMKNAPQCS